MTTSTSLYQLILNLLRDPEALADFQDNPEGYFAACGDFTADDVHDALTLIQDDDSSVRAVPPPVRRSDDSDSDDDSDDSDDDDSDDDSGTEDAIRYLNTYITNNYIDDRDTIVDNSVNQDIDTDGGDFDQDIDIDSVVASGDGSVAAGGDIEDSTITSGDDNQVGDDNVRGEDNVVGDDNQVVGGEDNTVAFGDGDADRADFGDVTVDTGSALSVGSVAAGEVDVDDSFNHETTETTTTTDVEDSFTTDDDVSTSAGDDSSTDVTADSHDETDARVLSPDAAG